MPPHTLRPFPRDTHAPLYDGDGGPAHSGSGAIEDTINQSLFIASGSKTPLGPGGLLPMPPSAHSWSAKATKWNLKHHMHLYPRLSLSIRESLNTAAWKYRRLCRWQAVLALSLLFFFLYMHFPAVLSTFICTMAYAFSLVRAAVTLLLWYISPGTAVPNMFPSSGNVLWYRKPAVSWSKEYLPVGNGFLAATVSGGTQYDETILNIEDLWSGGPFQNSSFNGGNPASTRSISLAEEMHNIRLSVFNSSTGTIPNSEFDVITTPAENYGSYTSPGRLGVTLAGYNPSESISDYTRWLDLDAGVARSQWSVGKTRLFRETFCSHPKRACIQLTSSSKREALSLTYALTPTPYSPLPAVSCFDRATMIVRGTASDPGMDFEILARVQTTPVNLADCSSIGRNNATITVHGATTAWITWVGGTDYDQNKGNAESSYSFKGPDPHDTLVELLRSATSLSTSYASLLHEHTADVAKGLSTDNAFQLSLGHEPDMRRSTDELFKGYQVDTGNPYLEFLLFEYGRYLLFSSSRGRLPANLQGKWARDSSNPWGADYHSNINIQMNYWSAEPTNLDVTGSLWNYIENTWAPRGAETALLLYNISRGWVSHNEMDIFGYTGMKGKGGTAQWANYPESAVWFMIHVWDHFDYTGDQAWWQKQGWPLLKGVASFHLDKLLEDSHFNDGTLVVAPCNSPEQPPITFGCAHAQQMLWQMFNAVEKGFAASEDTDTAFLREVLRKRDKMDKGLHIGSWGQLQGLKEFRLLLVEPVQMFDVEWKFDMDRPTDTHRHLSHLIGLYPGSALSGFSGQTKNTREELLNAAEVSLIHRGNGTGPDADAGWEKIWRAACWAQLGKAPEFYHELTYAVQRNFGANLFSLYDRDTSNDPIFQIDANLGYPGAVINALVQAPDVPSLASTLTVTILPALPSSWSRGSVKGLRIRGGLSVNMEWAKGKVRSGSIVADRAAAARPVEVVYQGKRVASFMIYGGETRKLSF